PDGVAHDEQPAPLRAAAVYVHLSAVDRLRCKRSRLEEASRPQPSIQPDAVRRCLLTHVSTLRSAECAEQPRSRYPFRPTILRNDAPNPYSSTASASQRAAGSGNWPAISESRERRLSGSTVVVPCRAIQCK